MAIFTAYATGHKSGQAIFSDLATVNYARTIYINVNGTQQDSWVIGASVTPSSSYVANFSDLAPNTEYEARCVVYRNSPWEQIYYNTANFTTLAPPIQPWEWYTPKTADDMVAPVTFQEWFDFLDKINEVRQFRGLKEYPFTFGLPFGKTTFLEATEALTPFQGLSPQLLAIKSINEDKWGTSSIVYPWYFNHLKAVINNAINM